MSSQSSPVAAPVVPPRIGVLALQGDVREHLRMLEVAGALAMPVRLPEELDIVDGLIIPGGESTTMIKLARIFDLFEPLQLAIKGGLPTFGTCAGMIMLADRIEDGTDDQETLGGLDVVVRRNAFGRQVDSFEAEVSLDLGDGPSSFPAVFIRAPWVEQVGPSVEVIARVSSGPDEGRIVAVRQGSLLATAFHPEMTGDDRVHRHFVQMVLAG